LSERQFPSSRHVAPKPSTGLPTRWIDWPRNLVDPGCRRLPARRAKSSREFYAFDRASKCCRFSKPKSNLVRKLALRASQMAIKEEEHVDAAKAPESKLVTTRRVVLKVSRGQLNCPTRPKHFGAKNFKMPPPSTPFMTDATQISIAARPVSPRSRGRPKRYRLLLRPNASSNGGGGGGPSPRRRGQRQHHDSALAPAAKDAIEKEVRENRGRRPDDGITGVVLPERISAAVWIRISIGLEVDDEQFRFQAERLHTPPATREASKKRAFSEFFGGGPMRGQPPPHFLPRTDRPPAIVHCRPLRWRLLAEGRSGPGNVTGWIRARRASEL